MRDNLFRSTPFRVTIILATTVLVSLIVAALVALQLIEGELARRMDSSIADSFHIIAQAYGTGDRTDMIDSVKSHADAAPGHERVFALAGSDGAMLAGNLPALPAGDGWMSMAGPSLGLDDASARYRVLIGDVAGNRLMVGQSLAEIGEIARLALNSIAWAGVVILGIVTAVGGLLALGAQRRINDIAATMGRVGHGQLAARIPVSARRDDIDILSGQVNAALDRVSGLVEGMRQVSVNIAHDLKTPLNRLAISVEAASVEAKSEPLVGLLGQATAEIQQINATFDALLRIAQIEAGARRQRFVALDLAIVLGRIRDAYVDVAEERQQWLDVQWDTDLPRIEGDAELLIQLCANLVENALRHGPAGTQVALTARRVERAVELICADDGPGVPDDERDKVFERLYRIDKSRSSAGNGLGLSLVKAIAELHGAKIALAHNDPGLRVIVRFGV